MPAERHGEPRPSVAEPTEEQMEAARRFWRDWTHDEHDYTGSMTGPFIRRLARLLAQRDRAAYERGRKAREAELAAAWPNWRNAPE